MTCTQTPYLEIAFAIVIVLAVAGAVITPMIYAWRSGGEHDEDVA